MSTPVSPVPQDAAVIPPVTTTTGATDTGDTTKIQISSMEELRTKAPKVYEAMVMGMALRIHSEQEAYMARMREQHRKQREG